METSCQIFKDDMEYSQRFIDVKIIAEGSFGKVYSAIDQTNQQKVAIKKMKIIDPESLGIDCWQQRELNILKQLNKLCNQDEQYVVKYIGHKFIGERIMVVQEFIEYDLYKFMQKYELNQHSIKRIMLKIVLALNFFHNFNYIHRDLKPMNILIQKKGENDYDVKLADFGCSRYLGNRNIPLTLGVVTLSYRAPEIFLENRYYGYPADIWSLGLIFAELFIKKPLVYTKKKEEIEHLKELFNVFGRPDDNCWPEMNNNEFYNQQIKQNYMIKEMNVAQLKNYFILQQKGMNSQAFDLFQKMTCYNPRERLDTREILKHGYFEEYREEYELGDL